jgi:hypothetical protein
LTHLEEQKNDNIAALLQFGGRSSESPFKAFSLIEETHRVKSYLMEESEFLKELKLAKARIW